MSVIFIVLPIALVLAGAGVAAFIWMARTGQLDDLETPAVRVLFDDEPPARQDGSGSPGLDTGVADANISLHDCGVEQSGSSSGS